MRCIEVIPDSLLHVWISRTHARRITPLQPCTDADALTVALKRYLPVFVTATHLCSTVRTLIPLVMEEDPPRYALAFVAPGTIE